MVMFIVPNIQLFQTWVMLIVTQIGPLVVVVVLARGDSDWWVTRHMKFL